MKKRITIPLFMLITFFVFSQNCRETRTEVLNGEIYDFQLEDCTTYVKINTSGKNTNLHGITLIDVTESINLKPTGSNRITIKPDDGLDFINLLITNVNISFESFIQSAFTRRTRNGNSNADAKDLSQIKIYPNPVDSQLTIESPITILYYKIVDSYGLTIMEGELPFSEQLQLSSLNTGIYYLIIETENDIITTRLYKN